MFQALQTQKSLHISGKKSHRKTDFLDKIQYFSVFTQDHTHSWENRPISIFIYSTFFFSMHFFCLFVFSSHWRKCLELDKNCLIVFYSLNWLKQLVYFWCFSQITPLYCYSISLKVLKQRIYSLWKGNSRYFCWFIFEPKSVYRCCQGSCKIGTEFGAFCQGKTFSA